MISLLGITPSCFIAPYDDKNYVFGTSLPVNKFHNNAGLDVSPAVKDYLGLCHQGRNQVSWQFVDFDNVPDGPWKKNNYYLSDDPLI